MSKFLHHCNADSYKPFPKQQIILDSSKLKAFADNFKFDENGRGCSLRAISP